MRIFAVCGILTLLALAILFFGACSYTQSAVNSVNKQVTVELVTQFDGISLYRVHTGDSIVFVAVRGNQSAETYHTYQSGKITKYEHTMTVGGN